MTSGTWSEQHTSQLAEELSRVFHDADQARLLVSRVGFPQALIPAFSTPVVYWHQVIQEITQGAIEGGPRVLAEGALKLYPHNQASYHSKP